MDTVEIIEGNRVIATMMGYEESQAMENYFNTPNGLELLHFHEDYGALMKAVKKILADDKATFSYSDNMFKMSDRDNFTVASTLVKQNEEVYCAWKCVVNYLNLKHKSA